MTATREDSLLRSIAPFLDKAPHGYVVLFDDALDPHMYANIKSAEATMKTAQKTLEMLQHLARDNKDLITSNILGEMLKTFHREIGRTMLTLGAEAVMKQ